VKEQRRKRKIRKPRFISQTAVDVICVGVVERRRWTRTDLLIIGRSRLWAETDIWRTRLWLNVIGVITRRHVTLTTPLTSTVVTTRWPFWPRTDHRAVWSRIHTATLRHAQKEIYDHYDMAASTQWQRLSDSLSLSSNKLHLPATVFGVFNMVVGLSDGWEDAITHQTEAAAVSRHKPPQTF